MRRRLGSPRTPGDLKEHPGPASLQELREWVSPVLQRMRAKGSGDSTSLQNMTLLVTSKWCGVGGMHIALKCIQQHIPFAMKLVSVCDFDKTCKKLLTCFRPDCLYSDMLDFYPADIVERVRWRQKLFRDELFKFRARERPDSTTFAAAKLHASNSFMEYVDKLFDVCQWKENSPCTLHAHDPNCCCPLAPENTGLQDVWLELVSPSCVDLSMQGVKMGWLGKASIPTIMWAGSLRFKCPDYVMLECTPRFDLTWIEKLSRCRIKFSPAIFGLDFLGIPVTGRRLWAPGVANGFHFAESPLSADRLQNFAAREIISNASIFCQGTEKERQKFLEWVNLRGAKLQPHPRGKKYRPKDYLGMGYQLRVEMHELRSHEVRLKQPHLAADPFFLDIQQTPRFSKRPSGILPRQLRNSVIWIESMQTLMMPLEGWAAQGMEQL